MTLSLLSLSEILSPVNIFAKFLALAPYRRLNGQLIISKMAVFQTILYLITYFTALFYFFEGFDKTKMALFNRSKGIRLAYVLRRVGYILSMLLSHFNEFHKYRKYFAEMEKLFKVDSELSKMDYREKIAKSGHTIRRKLLKLVVIPLLNIVLQLILVFMTIFFSQSRSFLRTITTFVMMIYPWIVTEKTNLDFLAFVFCVKDKFALLNDIILKKVEKSRNKSPKFNLSRFNDEIKRVVVLHRKFSKICQKLISFYSFHFLLWITNSFLAIVCDLYASAYIIVFRKFFEYTWLYLMAMKNLVVYVLVLFYFSKKCTALSKEANRTRSLLASIKIDVDKENERKTIIYSCVSLRQISIHVTACKLFKIDNALLFSICGAACSYLFIMIQLDLDNDRKNIK